MTTLIYVIDTHPLVWYFTSDSKLSSAASAVLDEMLHLADKKRIPVSIQETIARLQEAANFGIAALDIMVLMGMVPLRGYELHDRVIVATALSLDASIVTKDQHIRESATVPCVW